MKFAEQQQTTNPRTGKVERVFVDLQAIYPTDSSDEMSFEELRAAARGWLTREWSNDNQRYPSKDEALTSSVHTEASCNFVRENNFNDRQSHSLSSPEILEKSDNIISESTTGLDLGHTVALDLGRENKGSRTKRTIVKEIRGETQTSKVPWLHRSD